MAKRMSIEEFLIEFNKLNKSHIRLVHSSFNGMKKVATFIDEVYGEFLCHPHRILYRDCDHPARSKYKKTITHLNNFGSIGKHYKSNKNKICPVCNTKFISTGMNHKYCSISCRRVIFNLKNKIVHHNRTKTDINYKLSKSVRSRIRKAIKGFDASISTISLIGCPINELKAHLESKFQPGMTWENHGKWHIDHIIPLSSFNLINPDELKKACHFTNLQPLWAKDNLSKGDKIST